jgi:hypothetical protein
LITEAIAITTIQIKNSKHKGSWFGIELDRPDGDSDGVFALTGERLFTCAAQHGLFVKDCEKRVTVKTSAKVSTSISPATSSFNSFSAISDEADNEAKLDESSKVVDESDILSNDALRVSCFRIVLFAMNGDVIAEEVDPKCAWRIQELTQLALHFSISPSALEQSIAVLHQDVCVSFALCVSSAAGVSEH